MNPRLSPSYDKIVESLLFLMEEATADGRAPTQYELVKSVFIADLNHLKKFGRPITFDNYVAMQAGPVPIATYELLKSDDVGKRRFGKHWPFWTFEAVGPNSKAKHFRIASRGADLKKLSESDVHELRLAFNLVRKSGFGRVKDWTHENPAYRAAWRDGGKRAFEMDYRKLDPGLSDDLVDDLVHASKYA